jgi:hypothetical protein
MPQCKAIRCDGQIGYRLEQPFVGQVFGHADQLKVL